MLTYPAGTCTVKFTAKDCAGVYVPVAVNRSALTRLSEVGAAVVQSFTQPELAAFGYTSGRHGLLDCEYATVTPAGRPAEIPVKIGANWLPRATPAWPGLTPVSPTYGRMS